MPKTIRNSFDKYLSYEKLMEAHKKSRKGKGYNEIADYCYSKLDKNQTVAIEGRINSKSEIIIEEIYK